MDLGAEEKLANFWGHERDRPRRVLGEGTRGLQAGRHPQVCDPYCAGLCKQHVARLQIAVDHATLPHTHIYMNMCECSFREQGREKAKGTCVQRIRSLHCRTGFGPDNLSETGLKKWDAYSPMVSWFRLAAIIIMQRMVYGD